MTLLNNGRRSCVCHKSCRHDEALRRRYHQAQHDGPRHEVPRFRSAIVFIQKRACKQFTIRGSWRGEGGRNMALCTSFMRLYTTRHAHVALYKTRVNPESAKLVHAELRGTHTAYSRVAQIGCAGGGVPRRARDAGGSAYLAASTATTEVRSSVSCALVRHPRPTP